MPPSLGPLWFRIEQLLARVAADQSRSPLAAQIEIAETLNQLLAAFEDDFAAQGILGAAFLFSDSTGDGWSLFERVGKRRQRDPELARAFEAVTSVSTPYIVRPVAGCGTSAELLRLLVDRLFVEVRELQERAADISNAEPEFFAWLPRPDRPTPFPQEASLRELLAVHYVGEGELAIALISWRTLQLLALREARGIEALPDDMTPGPGLPETWLALPLASLLNLGAPAATLATELATDRRSWLQECQALLATPSTRRAAAHFASHLGVELGASGPLAAEAVLRLAEAYAGAVTGARQSSARERITAFERGARAPLPPYFFWQLGEGKPHAHLVAPVWTSAMNPLRLRAEAGEAIQSAVGLALSAVAPIGELEASLAGAPINPTDETQFVQTLTIISMLRQISRPLVEFVFYEPAKRRERSAQANQLVAAIMSRNLSHNIGSHVLYHLREELELRDPGQIDDLLLPEVLKDRRIAELIKYLQARMDFIALVSSEGSTWPGVVSLNSLRGPYLDPGALLLKHIVKSQRHQPPQVTFMTEAERAGGLSENPDFAIPTGAVGAQAVYSIIENFIRNSAKYGTAPVEAPLEVSLTIRGSDASADHWECLLKDNNRSVTESALRVVENFSRPIFDHRDPGQSHRNWGLKEIKIAALFLAGGAEAVRGQYDPDRPGYAGPQAEWILADEQNGECSLQLRFHLMRPLGICLVGDEAARAFTAKPLMHVFDAPAAMLSETAAFQRRYELLVVDRDAVNQMGSGHSTTALFQRAMRVAFVGPLPDDPRIAADPDKLSLASNWAALATMADNSQRPAWHAIGQAWVDRRWPGRTTVFASDRPAAEPEIEALVDLVVPEFSTKPPPDQVDGWLVWDHSRHLEKNCGAHPVFERFAFHRPVSHPVRVGLAPNDGPWRLKEAACLQIGVIDERIWGSRDKAAKDQGYKKVPIFAASLFDAWRRAGAAILDASLVNQWFTREATLHPLLAESAQGSGSKPYDFLVVHRSLIDKAASLEVERNQVSAHIGPDVRDAYVREIMAWLRQATHKLVITSGRGLEPAYHKVLEVTGAGFVEFSALADALIDNTGDKVGLVKLLRSV